MDINKRHMNFNPLTIPFKNQIIRKKFFDFNNKYLIMRKKPIVIFFSLIIFAIIFDTHSDNENFGDSTNFFLMLFYFVFLFIFIIFFSYKYENHLNLANLFVTNRIYQINLNFI